MNGIGGLQFSSGLRSRILYTMPAWGIEPSATQLYDYSRYGNHGTFKGDGEPDWVQLASGIWVMDFDGTDDHVTISDSASMNWTNKLSVVCWVNHDDVSIAGSATILAKYVTATANREWNFFKVSTIGDLQINFGDPNDGTAEGSQRTDAAHLLDTTWYLVGFTFDAGTVVIYVNGVAVASTATTVPVSLFNGTADLFCGSRVVGEDEWKGLLTLPRIYNRVLGATKLGTGDGSIYKAEKGWLGL